MATHSSVLAWRIPGTGEPGELPSMGLHRVRHDRSDLAAPAADKYYFIFEQAWLCLHIININCLKILIQKESLKITRKWIQFSSVAQLCPTLCDPMNCSTPSFPVHHQLLELAQTHIRRVGDATQSYHLSSPSPPAFNLSQHHQVAKVLAFQPQHQSFQWPPRTDLL